MIVYHTCLDIVLRFYTFNLEQAAPSALLAGQIADGIATPIVGYLSDRTKTKYGIKYLIK